MMKLFLWGLLGWIIFVAGGLLGIELVIRHKVIKTHGKAIYKQYVGWP